MTAYGFKEEFGYLIANGTKIGTVRRPRQGGGHARPGGKMQLYTGLRTKQAKKIIPDVRCFSVLKAVIDIPLWRVSLGGVLLSGQSLESFVRAEGFVREVDFFNFFHAQYPDVRIFEGVYILWEDPKRKYPYLEHRLSAVLRHSLPSKTELQTRPKTTAPQEGPSVD